VAHTRCVATADKIGKHRACDEVSIASVLPCKTLDVVRNFNGSFHNRDDQDTENWSVTNWKLCVDLGAFEYPPIGGADCTADLTGYGVPDFFDVSAFLSAFSVGYA
jgi:hypothetical protein